MPPLTSYVRSGPPPQLMRLLQQQQQPQGGGGANFLAQLIGGAGESAANVLQSYYDEPRAAATRGLEAASVMAPIVAAQTSQDLDLAQIEKMEQDIAINEQEQEAMIHFTTELENVYADTPDLSNSAAYKKALLKVKGLSAEQRSSLLKSAAEQDKMGLETRKLGLDISKEEREAAKEQLEGFKALVKSFTIGANVPPETLQEVGQAAGVHPSMIDAILTNPQAAAFFAMTQYPLDLLKQGYDERLIVADPGRLAFQGLGRTQQPAQQPVPQTTPQPTPPLTPTEQPTPQPPDAGVEPPPVAAGKQGGARISGIDQAAGDFSVEFLDSEIGKALAASQTRAQDARILPPEPADVSGVTEIAPFTTDPFAKGVVVWRLNPETRRYYRHILQQPDPLYGNRTGRMPGDKEAGEVQNVTATMLKTIREAINAKEQILALERHLNDYQKWVEGGKTGTWEALTVRLPKTLDEVAGDWVVDPRNTDAMIRNTRQLVGKMKEGGVLRKEDEVKYEAMLVNIADSPETAQFKLDMFKRETELNVWHMMKEFEAANFDMTGLNELYAMEETPPWILIGQRTPEGDARDMPFEDQHWLPLKTAEQREIANHILQNPSTNYGVVNHAMRQLMVRLEDIKSQTAAKHYR